MGRSGSTVFAEALSKHEVLGFFSNVTNRLPKKPAFALGNRFLSFSGEKPQRKKFKFIYKLKPRFTEAYDIWNYYFGKDFSIEFYPDKDIDLSRKQLFEKYIYKTLYYSNKERFLTKFTGPPRINFFDLIFEEPIYIDIVRDPRAVISSLLQVKFWIKAGINSIHWIDSLDEDEVYIWKKEFSDSPVALAALEWRKVYRQTIIERENSKGKYLKIKYEDFLLYPKRSMNQAIAFCGLNESPAVESYMDRKSYRQDGNKYRKFLSIEEINIIQEICKDEMQALDYKFD